METHNTFEPKCTLAWPIRAQDAGWRGHGCLVVCTIDGQGTGYGIDWIGMGPLPTEPIPITAAIAQMSDSSAALMRGIVSARAAIAKATTETN